MTTPYIPSFSWITVFQRILIPSLIVSKARSSLIQKIEMKLKLSYDLSIKHRQTFKTNYAHAVPSSCRRRWQAAWSRTGAGEQEVARNRILKPKALSLPGELLVMDGVVPFTNPAHSPPSFMTLRLLSHRILRGLLSPNQCPWLHPHKGPHSRYVQANKQAWPNIVE